MEYLMILIIRFHKSKLNKKKLGEVRNQVKLLGLENLLLLTKGF